MNIEEAKAHCEMLLNYGILSSEDEEPMKTVLSELEKKDKEVENLKKQIPSIENGTYTGDCEGLLKIEQEVIKKDKVINEMSKFIENLKLSWFKKEDGGEFLGKYRFYNQEEWIEYFTNKVEREGK